MPTTKTSAADLLDSNKVTLLSAPFSENIIIYATGDVELSVMPNKASMYFKGETMILAFTISNAKTTPIDVESIKEIVDPSIIDNTAGTIEYSSDYTTWNPLTVTVETDTTKNYVLMDVSTTIPPNTQIIRYLRVKLASA